MTSSSKSIVAIPNKDLKSNSDNHKDSRLNGDNYEAWSTKIQHLLEEQEVLGSLTFIMAKPEEGLTSQYESDLETYATWRKKNSTARIILLSAMEDGIANQFHIYEYAMDLWIALKHKFGGMSVTKLRTLALKFDTYKMRYDHTMEMHLRELSNMMSELSGLGQKITEEQKVQAVIRSLPNSWAWDHMKINLIRAESINTFEDAARHLEVEANRLISIKTNVEAHFSRRTTVENSSNKEHDQEPKKPKQEQLCHSSVLMAI